MTVADGKYGKERRGESGVRTVCWVEETWFANPVAEVLALAPLGAVGRRRMQFGRVIC